MRTQSFSRSVLMIISLVNDPETDEYVRWNDAGTSFIIPNSQLMAENVLPRSFKTINFASFVRQLNSNLPFITRLIGSVRISQGATFKRRCVTH